MDHDARKPVFGVCVHQMSRQACACASAQTDQRLLNIFLECTISKLATGEISIFQLVSVAEETDFSLALSDSRNTGYGSLAAGTGYRLIYVHHGSCTLQSVFYKNSNPFIVEKERHFGVFFKKPTKTIINCFLLSNS